MRALGPVFLLFFCGCGAGGFHGDGAPVQSIGDGDVHGIVVSGAIDVTVAVGGEATVVLEGADDDAKGIDVRVRGGQLLIADDRRGWGPARGPVKVDVTVPHLREAAVAGSGDLIVKGVRSDAFVATVSGSGGLHADGHADDVRVSIAGSGDIDVSALQAKTARVAISGSGNARLHASDRVVGSVAGSGDVAVAGGATCQLRIAGSGDVDC